MGEPILPPVYSRAQEQKRLRRTENGLLAAHLTNPVPTPFGPYGGGGSPTTSWYIPVTRGTLDNNQAGIPWVSVLDRLCRRAVKVNVPWVTDSATPGEMRLRLGVTGGDVLSSTASLAGGSSGVQAFAWLHDQEPWLQFDVWLSVEVRRVSGAGNVNIGYPLGGAVQCDPDGCTVTGL